MAGVDHRDPGRIQRVVGAPPQLGLGGGELRPVVHALRLGGVVDHHGGDRVAGLGSTSTTSVR